VGLAGARFNDFGKVTKKGRGFVFVDPLLSEAVDKEMVEARYCFEEIYCSAAFISIFPRGGVQCRILSMPERFISEPIKPLTETADTSRMALGEPGLPR